MSDAPHTEHWSSDDLESDAVTGLPATDHTCRPLDAIQGTQGTPNTPQDCPHDAGTQSGRSMLANGDSQAGPAQNGADATVSGQIDAGGAKSALDMTDERDRGMVRRELTRHPRRWAGVDPELKQTMLEGLKEAAGVARSCMATRVDALVAAKVMTSVVTTVVAMEAQCQKDEHRAEDLERLDNGQATQAIKLYGVGTPIEAV